MNTRLSPTSLAKPISWVTTTIVMPSSARERMTSSTSLTSSGSSAEVGSSKSISFGCMHRAEQWLPAVAGLRRVVAGTIQLFPSPTRATALGLSTAVAFSSPFTRIGPTVTFSSAVM